MVIALWHQIVRIMKRRYQLDTDEAMERSACLFRLCWTKQDPNHFSPANVRAVREHLPSELSHYLEHIASYGIDMHIQQKCEGDSTRKFISCLQAKGANASIVGYEQDVLEKLLKDAVPGRLILMSASIDDLIDQSTIWTTPFMRIERPHRPDADTRMVHHLSYHPYDDLGLDINERATGGPNRRTKVGAIPPVHLPRREDITRRLIHLALRWPLCRVRICKTDVAAAFKLLWLNVKSAKFSATQLKLDALNIANFEGCIPGTDVKVSRKEVTGALMDNLDCDLKAFVLSDDNAFDVVGVWLVLPFGWAASPGCFGACSHGIDFLSRTNPGSKEEERVDCATYVDDSTLVEADVLGESSDEQGIPNLRPYAAKARVACAMQALLGAKSLNEKKDRKEGRFLCDQNCWGTGYALERLDHLFTELTASSWAIGCGEAYVPYDLLKWLWQLVCNPSLQTEVILTNDLQRLVGVLNHGAGIVTQVAEVIAPFARLLRRRPGSLIASDYVDPNFEEPTLSLVWLDARCCLDFLKERLKPLGEDVGNDVRFRYFRRSISTYMTQGQRAQMGLKSHFATTDASPEGGGVRALVGQVVRPARVKTNHRYVDVEIPPPSR